MEGDDVDVALAQDEVGPPGLLRQVDAVQVPALAVDNGLGGIHILGLGLVQDPPAKGHHVPPDVDHREHEPAAELIVEPPLLAAHHQPCGQKVRLGVALLLHGGGEGVPTVQRGPQAEVHGGFPADLPPGQIGCHRLPLGPGEILIEPAGGVPVQGQDPLAAAGLLRVPPVLRHLQVSPLGQQAHRVREAEVFDLHDEVDHPAPVLAAEAVVDLLVRRHGEGAGLFIVEGAQAKVIAALFCQGNIGGDHVHNVAAAGHLVQKSLRKRHGLSLPL